MGNSFSILLSWLLLFLSLSNTPFSYAVETISGNKYLTLGTTIASPNERFELGFFKPGKSSNYYVGIWFQNIHPQTVIWVANRVTPIPSTAINSTKLKILDGNLVVVNGGGNLVWSTNITASATVKLSSVLATLLDNGNLVLISDDGIGSNSTAPHWQSFDHPTDTFLPGSKFGHSKRSKTNWVYTSWKNPDDPAPGLYRIDNDGSRTFQSWNGTEKYWITGPHFGFDDNLHRPPAGSNITIVTNEDESYMSYSLNPSVIARFVMGINGQHKIFTWMEFNQEWVAFDLQPPQECDVYAYCGPFGICIQNSSAAFCDCLYGFQISKYEKQRGCVRKTSLKCEAAPLNYKQVERDMFKMYTNVRLPRHPQTMTTWSLARCELTCLKTCSCTAYAYDNTTGHCSFWDGELLNLKQFGENDGDGRTIYIRLAASEFLNVKGSNSKHLFSKLESIILSVAVFAVTLLACSIWYVYYKKRTTTLKITEHAMDEMIIQKDDDVDDKNCIDVQFFTFESILEATNNFSDANKLGKGGFGPVYKGMLSGGQEIAVKRLSSQSKQGINEFKNEVVLIAKLQHRNLVRLLGYCTQATEKILLYEYMPNKSLDFFIFDQKHRFMLDWSKRVDVILGIVRGLLYLHHDSRLRIIHRDLKSNNILLDEEMTPKISDFGLARMVTENTLEVNTIKIVGTYGYMSPEYAISGLFSIKSDVFSFGVILLEIISGKKNTAFYQHEEVSNLLGYAWKLWNEGSAMDLVDDSLLECCNENEVLKCINIGLLCVEENPNCRPSMPNVLLMLADESMTLPKPKQPAFVRRTHTSNDSFTVHSNKPCSNHLMVSTQVGR